MRTIILIFTFLSLSASVLSQNLVAFYPFNGNNNDESGNAINPTYTGSGVTLTTDRFGNSNKACSFDGAAGSYMRMPADLLPTANRTVSFWFNAIAVTNRPFMLAYGGNGGPPGTSFLMGLNASGCGCYHTQGHYYTNAVSYAYGAEPINQWIHWVVTINGGTTKIYVNGNPMADVPGSFTSNTYVTGKDLAIGVMVGSSGIAPYTDANGGYFQGKLDDMRIYDDAMSDGQVQDLYNIELNHTGGLIAYYPFNGNANDETGNGFNGTVSGATLSSDRFNQSGKAYNFTYNGFASDKIQVPGTGALNFSTGGFSLSSWVQFSGTAGGGYNYPIVSKHECGLSSGYILMLYNNKLTFWLPPSSAGYNILSTPDDYTDGKWHQVVAVYDGTTQSIYIDGALKNSATTAYGSFNTANIALGGYNGCNGGFNGKVDEIKIYDHPLSATEIQSMYSGSMTDMVAYYPSNGNANDESATANHATVGGAVLTTDRTGAANKAYQFDESSKLTAPDNAVLDFGTGDFSITSWINASSITTGRIVSAGYTANDNVWALGFGSHPWWGSGVRMNYYVQNGGVSRDFNSNQLAYTPGQWAFAAVVKKSNILSFYFNGQLAGSSTMNFVSNSNSSLTIGARQNTPGVYWEFFNGKIDEVRIYKRALSANEILQLADVPMQPGLLAYLPMNGNANDKSGNGYNGTAEGGILTADKYGTANAAYTFPVLGNSITLPNSTSLNFQNSGFTFSAWIKYKNVNSIIVAKHNCWTPNGYVFYISNNQLALLMANSSGWSTITTNESFIVDKWYHVTAVYDGINQAYIYVDGVLKASGPVTYNLFNAAPVMISGAANGCPDGNFPGSLDEVKIYASPLDASQVMALYKQNRGSGNAVNFKGNDPNNINAGILDAPPEFTVEAWIKRNASASKQYVFSGTDDNSWGFGFSDDKLIIEKLGSTGVLSDPVLVNDNKWHHIAFTFKNDNVHFYFDGIPSGSGSIAAAGSIASTYCIGSRSSFGNSFDGSIDEVRVWGVELSQSEIRSWMNRKITGAHPQIAFMGRYYNFDETNISQTYDLSGGITGTLMNGPTSMVSGAPVGDGSAGDFINTTKSATLTLASGENFTASETNGSPSGISVYVVKDFPNTIEGTLGVGANDHYFGVHVSGGTTPQYTGVYDYSGNALVFPATEPGLQLFKRTDNGATSWSNSGATLNTVANTMTVTGQSTEYILGSSGFALPVTSLNLRVYKTNSTTAQLSWQTATEVNNRGFELQRSFDGNFYSDVKFISGAINADVITQYSASDIPGRTGRVYYRLRQFDLDGNSKFSNTVSVHFDKEGIIAVYPNPARQQVTVEGINNFKRVQMLDGAGKMVKEIFSNGQYQVNINLRGLKSGIYLLRMTNEKEIKTIKLVIGF